MNAKIVRPLALYIHVPFCRARCLYCSFTSRPAGPSTQAEYIERLIFEVEKYFASNPGWSIDTVYIGGGTPSMMSVPDIRRLMSTVTGLAPRAVEITFESNPHPDDIDKLEALRASGANRISVGVQSFDDTELGLAGRLHTSGDAERFLDACRKAGFDNLSIDLIHGLPNQSPDSFRKSLERAVEFHPEHLSLYGLSIEPTSRLGRLPERLVSGLRIPDGDTQAEMYDFARYYLAEVGYGQYEISNFALPGYECRHNLVYWSGIDYIGFGPGAASYIDGARFRRISDIDLYLSAQREGKNTVEYLENLSSERAAAEALVLGLRRAGGVDRRTIETRYGIKLTDLCGEAIERHREAGLLEVNDDNIKLSERAYFISNAVFRDIIL
jgi:oxygen-independent coproporphyrinogen-3 oxidase